MLAPATRKITYSTHVLIDTLCDFCQIFEKIRLKALQSRRINRYRVNRFAIF